MAQLVDHGACNARVVGLIPMGYQYEKVKSLCTHYCKALWYGASTNDYNVINRFVHIRASVHGIIDIQF